MPVPVEPAGPATVADLLEAAAARSPEATAVVAGDRSLTYAELGARANRLAHHLRSLGVGPDVAVGICLDRCAELAVALHAVLKAGGACVPLDPDYPPERLAFLAADAGVAVVLTRQALAGRVPDGTAPVVRVDDAGAWADFPVTAPARSSGPDDLGYVIYTSGSTGEPKGVLLTSRGLVNHHLAALDLYALGPVDRVLQFCSLGFDASVEEMFPTWAAGATVVFRPGDIPLLGRDWLGWLVDQRITVLNLPTAYWHAWARDLEALGSPVPDGIRLVVVGGEKARGPAYRAWARLAGGRSRWVNAYGPTETTCMSTFYEAPADGGGDGDGDGDPPIGQPLPNTTVVVVDGDLRPVPAGTTGELLIGGAGLARGYLNSPELTAKRFVEGPGGDRMYRTGDLVRELAGGDLDYVGRIDDQVKVRGFRIELGEVEAALLRHHGVGSAAVVARADAAGDRALAAYVVARGGATVAPAELRRFLAERLPAHMVPATVTVLDALPLTAHGKVDRAALAVPAEKPGPAEPPRSPAEATLAGIWARVLGLEVGKIGRDDDFFDLGGHSLLATQVVAQVREEFATETPLRALFEWPTLAGLAAAVEAEGAGAAGPPLTAGHRAPGAAVPLSLAQEQMWGLETAAEPPGLYNVTALKRFAEPVDEVALHRALAYLVERHEVLRAGVAAGGGGPYQFAVATQALDLTVTSVAAGTDEEVQRLVAAHDAAPFELSRPPLFRIGLFAGGDGSTVMAVTVDHLICDGTGIAILVGELVAAYEATVAGRPPALPALPVQFADFASWQRSHVTDDVLGRQLDWWLEILAGMPLGPVVPFDRLPTAPTRRIASRPVSVPEATRARLDEVARATGSTLFTVAVAAVSALFGRHGRTDDVVFSTTLSGRTRTELEGLIGMFSGIGRLRTDLAGDPAFVEVVVRARDRVLGMFENQDIPFLRVRRALLPDFPAGGPALAAALPVEFQYFHVEGDPELFFRGQLHPLSVTLLDDGSRITGGFSYKLDFYDPETVEVLAADLDRLIDAVAADPSLRLSELPVSPRPRPHR